MNYQKLFRHARQSVKYCTTLERHGNDYRKLPERWSNFGSALKKREEAMSTEEQVIMRDLIGHINGLRHAASIKYNWQVWHRAPFGKEEFVGWATSIGDCLNVMEDAIEEGYAQSRLEFWFLAPSPGVIIMGNGTWASEENNNDPNLENN